jgi:hypothetical protein
MFSPHAAYQKVNELKAYIEWQNKTELISEFVLYFQYQCGFNSFSFFLFTRYSRFSSRVLCLFASPFLISLFSARR